MVGRRLRTAALRTTTANHKTMRAAAVERGVAEGLGGVRTVLDELIVQPLPQPASNDHTNTLSTHASKALSNGLVQAS